MIFKKVISILSVCFISSGCGVLKSDSNVMGTPDQDIVVATLRNQFEQGAVPSLQSLRFGQKWKVRMSAAVRNSSQTEVKSGATFEQNGQIISLEGNAGSVAFVYTDYGLEASTACLTGCVWQKIILRAGNDGQIYGEQNSQPDAANLTLFSTNMYRSVLVHLANQNYVSSYYLSFTPIQ